MATNSTTLTWKGQWTEELGGLQSIGHKEQDTTEATHFSMHAHVTQNSTGTQIFKKFLFCFNGRTQEPLCTGHEAEVL